VLRCRTKKFPVNSNLFPRRMNNFVMEPRQHSDGFPSLMNALGPALTVTHRIKSEILSLVRNR
jgi:hypothetical protein